MRISGDSGFRAAGNMTGSEAARCFLHNSCSAMNYIVYLALDHILHFFIWLTVQRYFANYLNSTLYVQKEE